MKAKDPICGMTVDEVTALGAERDGKAFYFCSENCRQKFLRPGKKGGVAPLKMSSGSDRIYTCPMHPEIEQDHPGDCPKCGMRLELKNPGAENEADG
ncbi:MAG: heavy metal-binding domain-containing protein, partial [Candidatus Margulisiibacteriota bacterium]